MIKSPADSIKEKVCLVYESDRSSPLFTRFAEYEIQNNNLDKAQNIIQEGLKKYPNHPVAHILLGKVYARTGNYTQAALHIKTASAILGSERTQEYYLNEFEIFKSQRSVFQTASRKVFLNENLNGAEILPGSNESDKKFDQSLLDTINEITSHENKTTPKDVNTNSLQQDNLIISETLAKIYLAQGEIKEAIDVYNRLMIRNPEKIDYYQKKIDEISSDQQ